MATKKEAEEIPFEEMAPLTYTDQIYSMLGLWKTKGIDVNMMLIKEIEGAKKNLDVYRQKVDIDKNTLLLETNWDKVNEERKEQGVLQNQLGQVSCGYHVVHGQVLPCHYNTYKRMQGSSAIHSS